LSVIARVKHLWRYPVKSMRGEEQETAYIGFSGVYGDRIFAFQSSASPKTFPYLTARSQKRLLQYQPTFRDAASAAQPPNLTEIEQTAPGLSPLYPRADEWMVDVQTPEGVTFAIDDPALILHLSEGLREAPTLTLLRSDRAMTDCRPISLFGIQTAEQLEDELGLALDLRRFRANLYLDFLTAGGFAEDALVGRTLRIGEKVVLSVLEHDKRCRMISLDPETGASSPEILQKVARDHEGMAGIYAAVLVEGTVRQKDTVELID
jgi:uncharacterized protein YcbX